MSLQSDIVMISHICIPLAIGYSTVFLNSVFLASVAEMTNPEGGMRLLCSQLSLNFILLINTINYILVRGTKEG